MRTFAYVALALAVVFWIFILLTDPRDSDTPFTTENDQAYVELLDEALYNLGYVAGNAYGHAIWSEARQFVGIDGEYTMAFRQLGRPGVDDLGAALRNRQRYEEGAEAGRATPFDENENLSRTQRVIQIMERDLPAVLPSH